ncbi:MAG: 1,4-alpha-glucan branching enzyme GlgB [Parvibaculum sp.]|uniref:1,4-alpha-glucan branching protein GlgB n=1 Tax=Parvibaculum sp. TaxID=2024848 RepID=UPI0035B9B43F
MRRAGQPSRASPSLQAGRISALLAGDECDPFSYLGMHRDASSGKLVVRTFHPEASAVAVVDRRTGVARAELARVHDAGVFAGTIGRIRKPFPYRLRVDTGAASQLIDDPYSFSSIFGEMDLYLLAEGNHLRSFDKLGAHPMEIDGIAGTSFAVWAPNARRVSVVGDFNGWDGRRHAMRFHPGGGIWEIFLPGVAAGARYKYEIKTRENALLLKADPYAFEAERPPRTASVVAAAPRASVQRRPAADRHAPVAIYEVHLGSWRRVPEEGDRPLTYRELADRLVPYVKDMGFTHIELMPVGEHPFDGSWGYQPTGLFAPTSRYGTPVEFLEFVERCHAEGVGVILDWAAGHFPNDPHGLTQFDGTHLYEHRNPKEGHHPDWKTLIYNFGRNEVRGYLLANALFWLSRYGIDGLRVDAVASMLYRNYSRKEGEWIPNIHGGVENLEAVDFLRRLNELVYGNFPDAMMVAEESTAWPMVSRPTYLGGLGFGYKWNLGWMHDTLDYMAKDPVHRKYHHDRLTFGLLYAFTENFILPLSHDEVVHGKGSLLGKMPGDRWQKFANLRCYLAFMYTQPGKKLLFMGGEFAQEREWNHDESLDWHLLGDPMHVGVQALVRDLNHIYRSTPALHERDCESEGFSWIDCNDAEAGVISYLRRAADPADFAAIVCNFTPVVRRGYRIGVPRAGDYRELVNTDSRHYGGGDVGNAGCVVAEPVPAHGHAQSLVVTLPPLATLVFKPDLNLTK